MGRLSKSVPGLAKGDKIHPSELLGAGGTLGNVYYVVPTSETNYNVLKAAYDTVYDDGSNAFQNTLEAAYALCVSGRNDVIALHGNATHSLATGIAWTKSRIHVVGLEGGGRLVQQGAKIQLGGAVDCAYVIKVTGVRNSFRDVKIIQASTHANALHVLEEGGEGNLYQNVSCTFGVVDNLDQTTATEVLSGSDSATYIDCSFGTETLLTSAARSVFTIDQVTTSQEFKSNRLRGCEFLISSSETTATLLSVAANTDVLFHNLLEDCSFVASIDSAGGVALAVAVKSAASLVKGTLCFKDCAAFGCTNFATDAVGNDNFYVYGAPNATATDYVGTLPVAT